MEFPITYDTNFKPTKFTKFKVNVSDERFKELCDCYGVYGVDWYFVAPTRIKYFAHLKWKFTAFHP